jgi:outer membrane murein-binding lipoprotein Lpp
MKSNLTLVQGTKESTPKEGEIMTKEDLKAAVAKLKADQKALKDQIKAAREEEKAAKAAAKAAGLTPGYSRSDATADFIKGMTAPLTLVEIVDGSNSLYTTKKASEKANNPKEARSVAASAVQFLVAMGYMTKDGDKFSKV